MAINKSMKNIMGELKVQMHLMWVIVMLQKKKKRLILQS